MRPESSCSSWDYTNNSIAAGGGGGGSSSSGVSSAGDRSSILLDTSASSSTSRASSGSHRMLRSTTVDEDDGWSTDFSLSDEDMGETYLDHVEVTPNRQQKQFQIQFVISLFFFKNSRYVAVTSCWPTTHLWVRPRPVYARAIWSTWCGSAAPDGGTSVRHRLARPKKVGRRRPIWNRRQRRPSNRLAVRALRRHRSAAKTANKII